MTVGIADLFSVERKAVIELQGLSLLVQFFVLHFQVFFSFLSGVVFILNCQISMDAFFIVSRNFHISLLSCYKFQITLIDFSDVEPILLPGVKSSLVVMYLLTIFYWI